MYNPSGSHVLNVETKDPTFFFLNKGKDPELPLNGGYKYKQGPQDKRNYIRALELYIKDLKTKSKNAIRPFSTKDDDVLNATAGNTIAGDETTWRRRVEGCHDGDTKRPPQ